VLWLLLIKICIQYCGCSPSQFCRIKEPPLSLSCTNWWIESRGGSVDTTFEAKDSEKVRGQGQSCREQVASRPRTRLKIRANINVNIVIMISQAFKHKIVWKWARFESAYKSVSAKSIATILCLLHPTLHCCLLYSLLLTPVCSVKRIYLWSVT